MKKLFTLLSLVIVMGASAQRTLIHYWNFNAAAAVTDTSVLFKPTYTIGGAGLNYAGTGAVTSFAFTTPDSTNQRLPETDPTTVNYIKVAAPYGPFTWTIPTTGYKNIIVSFAVYSSGKGSKINTITYTLDGKKWDSAGMIMVHKDFGTTPGTTTTTGAGTYYLTNTTGAPMDSIGLDFSNIPGANNNPLFQVQTNFDPAATAGNDRYNNLAVDGILVSLPISLQSFNGAIVNDNAKLFWSSNEVNAKEFVIEASTNRKNFTQIGTVTAKNAKGTNSYEFESAATATTTYYRLKMIDKNGSFTYSSIVALNATAPSKKLITFPNPAINSITLTHEQATAGAIIKILTVDGKNISTSFVQTGASETSVDVSKLAKGNYIVSYENNGSKTSTQFVK